MPKSAGLCEFAFPRDVRIVGRVRGFAVRLPAAHPDFKEDRYPHRSAPLILPWEQPSLTTLLRTNRLLFGLTDEAVKAANEIFGSRLGREIGRRTIRRYEHETATLPQTGHTIALTLFHAARLTDVLRLLRVWKDDSGRHSLEAWNSARRLGDLPARYLPAPSPIPAVAWRGVLNDWGEWPGLLSMALPRVHSLRHRLLRIDQAHQFDGLDPLIRSGSLALIEEMNSLPTGQGNVNELDWDRPIYAIQHAQQILCGYVGGDDEHIVLLPHPRSSARRVSFLRSRVTVLGRVIGLASPLHP
jgi:hypothetical protein